ncbi:hypothetical protein [Nitrincola tapanii]|nr:hypothetical protein [Nitrincola tapanii]
MKRLTKIKAWLYQRADQARENFFLLLLGFGIFLLGLMLVTAAEFTLLPSLGQELMALAGLILIGLGSILAFVAYLCLSILRVMRFLDSDDEQSPPRY